MSAKRKAHPADDAATKKLKPVAVLDDEEDLRWREPVDDTNVRVTVIGPSHKRTYYLCDQPLKLVSSVWREALGKKIDPEADGCHELEIKNVEPWVFTSLVESFYPGQRWNFSTAHPEHKREVLKLAWQYDIQCTIKDLLEWVKTTKDVDGALLIDQLSGKLVEANWTGAMQAEYIKRLKRTLSRDPFSKSYPESLSRLPNRFLARLLCRAALAVPDENWMHSNGPDW